MHKLVASILVLFFSGQVLATAQTPDYLIYEGEKLPLHVNPLEQLFQNSEDLRPETEIMSSGNWRGYIATFEIKGDSMHVADITITVPGPNEEQRYIRESVLDEVFPKKTDREMKWFSGILIIPVGKQTEYVHLSYASQYDEYLLIKIADGIVTEKAEMNGEEYKIFKTRQFQKYKKTKEYRDLYEKLSKDSESGDEFNLEGFIFQMGGFTHKIEIPFQSHNEQPQRDASRP